MIKYNSNILLLSIIFITACNPEKIHTLELECPEDIIIELSSASVPSNTINLPLPIVFTDCEQGKLKYATNLPEFLHAGIYTVNYIVSNECGNEDTCSFQLTTTFDYRKPFIGTYIGNLRTYFAYHLQSVTSSTVNVSYGNKPNTLLVDNDEVPIDSTGSCPYPSCCSYRFYMQRFWSDSIYVYKNCCSIGSPTEHSFKGKKQ